VLAVEIHQRSVTSSDIAFNLQLTAQGGCGSSGSNAVALTIEREGSNVVIRWPASCDAYVLEQTGSNGPTMAWEPINASVTLQDGYYRATLLASHSKWLFRLRKL